MNTRRSRDLGHQETTQLNIPSRAISGQVRCADAGQWAGAAGQQNRLQGPAARLCQEFASLRSGSTALGLARFIP